MTDPQSGTEIFSAFYDTVAVTEVIRPAAIVPEEAARAILVELAVQDARREGRWLAEPARWERYDRTWDQPEDPGGARLVGSIEVAYGVPTRYDITIFRVTVTQLGERRGFSVSSLCDEVLVVGGLTLDDCPRVALAPPPPPFRMGA